MCVDGVGMSMEAAMIGSQVRSEVAFAVAKKSLDMQGQQGEALVAMIESAAEIAKGNTGSVTPAPGSGDGGGMVDVYA